MDDPAKILSILSSKNPDTKITATSAMDASQKVSHNLESEPVSMRIFYDPAPTFDMKNCLYYFSGTPGDCHNR